MKMPASNMKSKYKSIPVRLTENQFNEFVLPHLSVNRRGPTCRIPLYRIYHYVLTILYTGMQWKQLPIQIDPSTGKPEIHYTRVFRIYQRWCKDGSLARVFENTVYLLNDNKLLDLSVLHGDGTSTAAKKGGDNIGYNGHKHFKGEKIVVIVDRNVNVIAPYVTAPGNRNESGLLKSAISGLKEITRSIGASIAGSTSSLDGVYDSKNNRKIIFNAGMTPNIPENKRNRKKNQAR